MWSFKNSVFYFILFLILEKELLELFPKKDLTLTRGKKQPVKSALSEALDLFPAVANNPFNEYARFDGRVRDECLI